MPFEQQEEVLGAEVTLSSPSKGKPFIQQGTDTGQLKRQIQQPEKNE